MNLRIHDSPAVFRVLAPEWDDLVQRGPPEYLFCKPMLQALGYRLWPRGALHVVELRQDGQLAALAPLQVVVESTGVSMVTLANLDVTDCMDLILRTGAERQALACLLEYLLSPDCPEWNRITLQNVPAGSPTLRLWPGMARDCGLHASVEVADVCPGVMLPADRHEYLALLGSRRRGRLVKKRRLAVASGAVEETLVGAAAVLPALPELTRLMAASHAEKGDFLDEPLRTFLRGFVLALDRSVVLSFLRVSGRRVAGLLELRARDCAFFYNSGRDPAAGANQSLGIALLLMRLEAAIADGLRYYDFLRGGERYKYDFGASDRYLYTLELRR